MSLTHKVTGETFFWAMYCDSWTHLECARRMAEDHLTHIAELWKEYPTLYATRGRAFEEKRKRINQRAKRAGAKVIRIDRYFGEEHLYSTVPLNGRLSPNEWEPLPYSAALHHLQHLAMTIVGVKRIAYAKGWHPKAPATGKFFGSSVLSRDDFGAIFEIAQGMAVERYGVHVEPRLPLPAGITPIQLRHLLELAEMSYRETVGSTSVARSES